MRQCQGQGTGLQHLPHVAYYRISTVLPHTLYLGTYVPISERIIELSDLPKKCLVLHESHMYFYCTSYLAGCVLTWRRMTQSFTTTSIKVPGFRSLQLQKTFRSLSHSLKRRDSKMEKPWYIGDPTSISTRKILGIGSFLVKYGTGVNLVERDNMLRGLRRSSYTKSSFSSF